ncbi:MAG: GWxTD domain-containing protein [Candidatus Eisenbacteria bacterium]|nr:GWxTD domain-containing protein [Candidatus Eisenbacteria bacterium]
MTRPLSRARTAKEAGNGVFPAFRLVTLATRRRGIQAAAMTGMACLCVFAAGMLPQARAAEPGKLPMEASGEIPFVADGTLFLSPEGRAQVHFVLAVPQDKVRCVESEEQEGRWMQIDLVLQDLDSEGQMLLERRQPLDVACVEESSDSLDADLDRLVFLDAPWRSGTGIFTLRLEDRNASRVGIVYELKDEKKRGTITARAPTGGWSHGVGLSGCMFLWSFSGRGFERQAAGFWTGPAERRGYLAPHPARFFGLRNPTLRFYAEVYGLAGDSVEARTILRRAGDSEQIYADTLAFVPPLARSALVREVDVSRLPAGSYDLALEIHHEDEPDSTMQNAGRHVVSRAEAGFEVLWRAESWMRLESEWLQEASLILDEETMARFRTARPGEREKLEESVWQGADGPFRRMDSPTQALFRERVKEADDRFGGRVRGSQTDRGRVFVRFGPPDEVSKELMPLEMDRIAHFLEREVDPADPGEALWHSTQDDSAYEVWDYTGKGNPLFSDDPAANHPLRFVFVDKLGIGNYRLVYTNLYGGM